MSKILTLLLLATGALARAAVVHQDSEPAKLITLTPPSRSSKRFVDLPKEVHWSEVVDLAVTNSSSNSAAAMHGDPHGTLAKRIRRGTGEVGSTTSLVEIGFNEKGHENMILLCDDPKWEKCSMLKPPKNRCLKINPKHDNQISSATAFKGISCYLYE